MLRARRAMRSGLFLLGPIAVLAACGNDGSADQAERQEQLREQQEAKQAFGENAYAFCMARDSRWLAKILDRIRRSLPYEYEPMSLLNERVRIQSASADGVISGSWKKLQFDLAVTRDDQKTVELVASGIIEPLTCKISDLTVVPGPDFFSDRKSPFFDAPAPPPPEQGGQ